MTKEIFKSIVEDNNILPFEVNDSIYFVSDLLEAEAQYLEQTEPYATNSITKLRNASHAVSDLLLILDEMEES